MDNDSEKLSSNATPMCKDDYEDYGRINRIIHILGPLCLIILGTIGDALTIIIFRKKVYATNIMAGMFKYLSFLDLVFLWIIMLSIFINGASDFDILSKDVWICFTFMWCSQCLISLSNWLLVVITCTRFVHLKWPLKVKSICSKFTYYLTLVFIHLLVISIHGSIMIQVRSRYTPPPDTFDCHDVLHAIVEKGAQTNLEKIVYIVVNFIGPAVMLVTVNILIITEMRLINKQHDQLVRKQPSVVMKRATRATLASTFMLHTPSGSDITTVSAKTDQSQNALQYEPPYFPELGQNKCVSDFQADINTLEKRYAITNKEAGKTSHKVMSRIRRKALYKTASCNVQRFRSNDTLSTVQRNISRNNTDSSIKPIIRPSIKTNIRPTLVPTSWLVQDPSTKASSKASLNDVELEVAQLAVGGNSSQARDSTPARFSFLTFISDALSQGVDVEVDEDRVSFSNRDTRKSKNPTEIFNQSIPDQRRQTRADFNRQTRADFKFQSRTQSMTLMLITASIVFLLVSTPYWILVLQLSSWLTEKMRTEGCNLREIIVRVVLLIRYSNNSLNFIFYCVSGSRFREEMFALIRSWGQKLSRCVR